MFVESLELDNFKSFGTKTRILFRKGFTVISGPNGSGKSNIGDSFLFVLGERSNKTVRADRLGDLIHKAPKNERQRNYCSVAIRLDTEDPNLLESDRKVEIRREIVSDHEGFKSNYFLNGIKVRFSEVSTMLDSLRIFLDSYSFVLQGDINNIVKMSGGERRKLLESISGIEIFDRQIEKAESDIDSLNENLGKLEVIREQLGSRKISLEREREVAQKYLDLSRRIKDLKSTELTIQQESLRREIASQTDQIGSLESETISLNSGITELMEKINEIREKINEAQNTLDHTGNAELKSLREKIQELRIELASNRMKSSDLRDTVASIRSELEKISNSQEDSINKVQWIESNIATSESILRETNENLSKKYELLKKMRESNAENSRALMAIQESIKASDGKIAELTRDLENLSSRQKEMAIERSKMNAEMGSLESRIDELEFQIRDYTWSINEIRESDNQITSSFEELNRRYYSLKSELAQKRKRKDEIMRDLSSLNREYSQIQISLGSRGQNFNRAQSAIMDARNHGEISGIIGPVKDLITFDQKFRMAVESAAGGRMNAIVVKDDAVAEECLSLLKSSRAGKLTFLPLNKMLPGRPRGKAITVRSSEGSLGYIFENVKFSEEYSNVIWYVFQDTVIIDSVRNARRYMGGVRLVTLDGDIFEASGAISGGFSEKSKNNEDLESRSRVLSETIKSLNDELSALDIEISDISASFESVSADLQKSSSSQGSQKARIDMLNQNLQKSRDQLAGLHSQRDKKKRELEDMDHQISEIGISIDQIRTTISSESDMKERSFEELRRISPSYAAQDEDLNAEIESLREKAGEYNLEISRLRSEKDFILKNLEISRSKNIDLNAELSTKTSQISDLVSRETDLSSELEKLMALETQIDERTRDIVEKIRQMEKEQSGVNDQIEYSRSMVSTKREMIITLQGKRENSQNRLKEIETEKEQTDGVRIETVRTVQEARSLMADAMREVESLGPVNQKAIEEFDSVSRDLDSINSEIDQISSEKKALSDLTYKLTEQKKVAFMEMYEGINTSMRTIYGQLSGGGDAYLELSNTDNPLESEVTIRARPKGSNFSKLEALSGGEKSLTALSFILAVQRINPSPFYYLDEVDMFLDGANAERVGKLFKSNSNTSQIFSVSLRKSMLKYADNVVGVMNPDGENSRVYEKSFLDEEKTDRGDEGEPGRDP